MASYETRGNSTRAIISLPGGGKLSETFDTRAEAEAWGEKQERLKKAGGAVTAAGTKTVGDLLEIYLDLVASKSDSARWNNLRLKAWMISPISTRRVVDITTHDMDQWMSDRGKATAKRNGVTRPISGSTINREMNLWSAAFTYAVKALKWIKVNPCHGAARPPEASPRNRDLLRARELTAISLAGGYAPDEPLITDTARAVACFFLALETGMRSGEILRLRPSDYNRLKRTIKVAALEVGGRKGSKSGRVAAARYVPLTGRAIELLDQLLAAMPSDQVPAPGFTGPPYIVGMNDQSRDALWRKVRNMSGVEDLTFHDTKHEACTRLAPLIDVLELSHAVGTKDIRLLRDTYYVNDAAGVASRLPARLALVA